MVGTFSGKKSLKALSNKVFRFIQQTLPNFQGKSLGIFPPTLPDPVLFDFPKAQRHYPTTLATNLTLGDTSIMVAAN